MLTPDELARAYDRFVVALYCGNARDVQDFARWLTAFWTLDGPAEPDRLPDAVSFLGVIGRGLRWHALDGVILGYEQGSRGGCYQVPVAASPPPAPPPRGRHCGGWDAGWAPLPAHRARADHRPLERPGTPGQLSSRP
jgi:hypothetical protein